LRAIVSSRQIASEAVAEPPGLSIRRTIARIDESRRACRMYSVSVSDPADAPFSGSKPLRPPAMAPLA
jgi:hypothetical protein